MKLVMSWSSRVWADLAGYELVNQHGQVGLAGYELVNQLVLVAGLTRHQLFQNIAWASQTMSSWEPVWTGQPAVSKPSLSSFFQPGKALFLFPPSPLLNEAVTARAPAGVSSRSVDIGPTCVFTA